VSILTKKKIPFLFLLSISVFWAFYYQSSNILNDYGNQKPEWLLFIDGLIVLPFLCLWCIKDKKEALLKALAYACLIILLGSFIIPESSKLIWHYLESGRYLVITAFVILEVVTIFTVFFAIKASLTKNKDPDLAISQPIEKILGKGFVSAVLSFEARVWTYVLFSKKIKSDYFSGKSHFSCHLKDGTQSYLLGFLLIIMFELPIVHILLHFLWSPFAANVTTILTLLGLVFFIAEYKAISIRPVSITTNSIIIRYGVWNPLNISLNDIEFVQLNSKFIARSSNVKRYNLSGNPNIKIKLNSGKFIYLGLDLPNKFILALKKHREKSS
jgi:hypothetical protein